MAVAFAAGSVPVANLTARALVGVDLRHTPTGTPSGSALYDVTGFGPLAAAGAVELAKGALGPVLAGRQRPLLGALAAAVAVAGHNWSPWLRGQGGRGISLLLGATAALAPEATVVLGLGLGVGRLRGRTGAGTLVALLCLPALLSRTRGRRGLATGCLLIAPVLVKRLLGNENRLPGSWSAVVRRLVADAGGAGPGPEAHPR